MVKQKKVEFKYDINGNQLYIDSNNDYSGIPERCPECNCVQSINYKDFSNKRIQICGQCGEEIYLQ